MLLDAKTSREMKLSEVMSESAVTVETNENTAHIAVCNEKDHCDCSDTKESVNITVSVSILYG